MERTYETLDELIKKCKEESKSKFVNFIRRKSDDYYEMVIIYGTEKCYKQTKFYYDESFDINDYVCEPNQGKNYPSQLYFYFKKDDLDKVEKVFNDVTGRTFLDLKSDLTTKKATIENVFEYMHPVNKLVDCDTFYKKYSFD